jgi:UDP:flavonoid glycosyltransferase YjiC (YdhE family)
LLQVSLPVGGDQLPNGRYMASAGTGEVIPFDEVTEENLMEAIQKVLNNPSYTKKAQDLGKLLTDQG